LSASHEATRLRGRYGYGGLRYPYNGLGPTRSFTTFFTPTRNSRTDTSLILILSITASAARQASRPFHLLHVFYGSTVDARAVLRVCHRVPLRSLAMRIIISRHGIGPGGRLMSNHRKFCHSGTIYTVPCFPQRRGQCNDAGLYLWRYKCFNRRRGSSKTPIYSVYECYVHVCKM